MKKAALLSICFMSLIISSCEELLPETEKEEIVNPSEDPQDNNDVTDPNNENYIAGLAFPAKEATVFYQQTPVGTFTFNRSFVGQTKQLYYSRSADETYGYVDETSAGTYPISHILSEHSANYIYPWNDKSCYVKRETDFPDHNLFDKDITIESSNVNLANGLAVRSFIFSSVFIPYYNAYRNLPNKKVLKKGETTTIAGVETTQWTNIYSEEGLWEVKSSFWIDKDGNCYKYAQEKTFPTTGQHDNTTFFEITSFNPDIKNADDIIESIYGKDNPMIDKLANVLPNVYTLYDNRWCKERYPDNFESCLDWNELYKGLTVDDLIPPYQGSGYIESMSVQRDFHPIFNGVFEIDVIVKDASPEDIEAYCSKIKAIPFGDATDMGNDVERDVFKRSGDSTEYHPLMSFGDEYGYLQYSLYHYKDSNLFVIKIEIIRNTIV